MLRWTFRFEGRRNCQKRLFSLMTEYGEIRSDNQKLKRTEIEWHRPGKIWEKLRKAGSCWGRRGSSGWWQSLLRWPGLGWNNFFEDLIWESWVEKMAAIIAQMTRAKVEKIWKVEKLRKTEEDRYRMAAIIAQMTRAKVEKLRSQKLRRTEENRDWKAAIIAQMTRVKIEKIWESRAWGIGDISRWRRSLLRWPVLRGNGTRRKHMSPKSACNDYIVITNSWNPWHKPCNVISRL